MKKLITLICLGLATMAKASPPPDSTLVNCEDLFFSEILREDVIVSGTHYGNYSIEIFNPRPTSIALSAYSLKCKKANGTVVLIDLHGTIAAKGTYVTSFSNAESTILALSDFDTTALDFNEYV